MKLSIVDLATIQPGETATDALAQSLDTARLADRLGYHRIWFAEHHMAPAQASHHPELLIAPRWQVLTVELSRRLQALMVAEDLSQGDRC